MFRRQLSATTSCNSVVGCLCLSSSSSLDHPLQALSSQCRRLKRLFDDLDLKGEDEYKNPFNVLKRPIIPPSTTPPPTNHNPNKLSAAELLSLQQQEAKQQGGIEVSHQDWYERRRQQPQSTASGKTAVAASKVAGPKVKLPDPVAAPLVPPPAPHKIVSVTSRPSRKKKYMSQAHDFNTHPGEMWQERPLRQSLRRLFVSVRDLDEVEPIVHPRTGEQMTFVSDVYEMAYRSPEYTASEVHERVSGNTKFSILRFLKNLSDEQLRQYEAAKLAANRAKFVEYWNDSRLLSRKSPLWLPLGNNRPPGLPGGSFTFLDFLARAPASFCIRRAPSAQSKRAEDLDPMHDFLVSLQPPQRLSELQVKCTQLGVDHEFFYSRVGTFTQRYPDHVIKNKSEGGFRTGSGFSTDDSTLSRKLMLERRRSAAMSTISPQGLTHVIPTYFVPVEMVVKYLSERGIDGTGLNPLPNLTEEELVEGVVGSEGALAVAKRLAGRTWIRLHGGSGGLVDLSRTYEAEKLMARYKPDPLLLPAIKKLLDTHQKQASSSTNGGGGDPLVSGSKSPQKTWVPVDLIFRTAPQHVRSAFQSQFNSPTETLIYFEQMPHKIACSTHGRIDVPGEAWVKIAWVGDDAAVSEQQDDSSTTAAAADDQSTAHRGGKAKYQDPKTTVPTGAPQEYTFKTSPLPLLCQELVKLLEKKAMAADSVELQLSEPNRRSLKAYGFPDLHEFLKLHSDFWFQPLRRDEGRDVAVNKKLRRKAKKEDGLWMMGKWVTFFRENQVPAEERLKSLEKRRSGGDFWVLCKERRVVMCERHPESPFAEGVLNILKECLEYLPKKGFVPFNIFFMKVVPAELHWWLPRETLRVLLKNPDLCQVFECDGTDNRGKMVGRCGIMRTGLPLPRRAIKKDFTPEETLKLVIGILKDEPNHAMKGSRLINCLPLGIQMMFEQRRLLFLMWLEKHDKLFKVDFGDTVTFALRFSRVSLQSSVARQVEREDNTVDSNGREPSADEIVTSANAMAFPSEQDEDSSTSSNPHSSSDGDDGDDEEDEETRDRSSISETKNLQVMEEEAATSSQE